MSRASEAAVRPELPRDLPDSLEVQIIAGGAPWRVDLAAPIDISRPLDPGGRQPRAFFLPRARARPFRRGAFIADTRQGAGVNCDVVTLCPHSNGTHTECVGHVTTERIAVSRILDGAPVPATLVTVTPERLDASGETYPQPHDPCEQVLTRRALAEALRRIAAPTAGFQAGLVIRTRGDHADSPFVDYSGTQPPYLSAEAIDWIIARGVRHLCIDLPSLDREEDGGRLLIHRRFWGLPPAGQAHPGPFSHNTVTEMIHVAEEVPDGLYLLSIQIPPLALDAAPSRPLLFPVTGE